MVVSLAFVNGFHHWLVIKWFPPCSTLSPLFTWLGFVPFWAVWIEDLGPTIASSFCYFPSYVRPCYTLYDILLRHRSTLYSCGYDRLLSVDPPCSFVAMAPLDLIWRLFAYWATMIVSSVIHMLDPPISLWWCFVYGLVCPIDQFFSNIYLSFRYLCSSLFILDSLLSPYSVISSIMYFGYHLPL